MPIDLDTRIRALVLQVVDLTPPAPDSPSDLPEPRRPRRSPLLVAFSAMLVVALVVAGLALLRGGSAPTPARRGGDAVVLDLDDIPEGVSADAFRGTPVFLVRDGGKLTVFLSDPHRLPGDRELWWCPAERVFGSPAYAEVFVADGRKLGGPAPRGLDRFAATVDDGIVTVALDEIERGSTRSALEYPRTMPDGIPHESTWNTGPRAFCADPVIAGGDRAIVPLDAIPSGVSGRRLGPEGVIFVRDGSHVTVFVNDAQHLAGEPVVWCPASQVFYAPTHGERFAVDGTYLSGPARRGLDRLPTTSSRGVVTIDKRHPIKGEPVRERRSAPPPPVC